MLQRKSKKILIYFFLFIILGTLNNQKLSKLEFTKINKIKVIGLNKVENEKLQKDLQIFKINNIFVLDKSHMIKLVNSNNLIEKYSIIKRYPSTLEVKINRTKFLAYVKRNNIFFFLGSNRQFIQASSNKIDIPFFFFVFNNEEFFKLKEIIDKSEFDYNDIKNLTYFPSGRWNIETKSNIMIKLPKNELEKSIILSNDMINDNKFKNIKIIDLRQTNMVITNEF